MPCYPLASISDSQRGGSDRGEQPDDAYANLQPTCTGERSRCAGGACAVWPRQSGIGGGFLPRQVHHADRRLQFGWWLRHLRPRHRAALLEAHGGQSQGRRQQHAGRGKSRLGELSLQCRSKGRHRDRDLRARACDGAADRLRQGSIRSHETDVARQRFERVERLRGLGEIEREDVRGHVEDGSRRRRRGLGLRSRHLCDARAQSSRRQDEAGDGLSGRQRHDARDRARRDRRAVRLVLGIDPRDAAAMDRRSPTSCACSCR